jgi:oligopeptide/dipeptide ABC transporter ATP-binding protein
VIEARGIARTFPGRGGMLGRAPVRALRGIDLTLPDGGAASFIGESGCGKTTLGRILSGLEEFDGGELVIDGQPMTALPRRRREPFFRRIQMIHSDPDSALNPARTIGQILGDPLDLRARQRGQSADWVRRRRAELLELVGLDPHVVLTRYPHMLSGGMRQRVVIARALTVDPEVLVADEAVSMVDVSLRLGILRLLRDLREGLGVSVVFITHDVAATRYLGGELYVMYRGTVVEHGRTDDVIASPVHPYTQCLLAAIPVLRGIEEPASERPAPLGPLDELLEPPGCLFEPRCPFAAADCTSQVPSLAALELAALELDAPGLDAPGLAAPGADGHEHACLHPRRRSVVAVPASRPDLLDEPS